MSHENNNGRDAICNMKLPMVGTLYATKRYQWWEPYMQHTVTNGHDPICNIYLPMVGTVYAT